MERGADTWQPSPEEIEQLLSGGYITPETAALFPSPEPAPPPAPIDTQADWMSELAREPMRVDGIAGPTPGGVQYPTPEGIVMDETGHLIAPEDASPYATNPAVQGAPPVPQPLPQPTPAPVLTQSAPQAVPVTAAPVPAEQQVPALANPAKAKRDATTNLDNIDAAYSLQQQAVAEGAAVGIKQAAAEASYQKTLNDQLAAQAEQQAQKERDRQAAIDAQMQKVQTALTDYQSQKIDSQRFWHNSSTGTKILAALSIALGGIGQGLQAAGGVNAPNQALGIIKSIIDNDIEEQKFNIATKRESLDSERGIYHDMRARFGDERNAELAARTVALNNAQLKLQELASQYKAPALQANAKLLYGQIEAEKAKNIATIQQNYAATRLAKQAAEQSVADAVMSGRIDPSKLTPEQKAMLVPVVAIRTTKMKDGSVKEEPVVVATGGFAADAPEARELRDRTNGYLVVRRALNNMLERRRAEGAVWESNPLSSEGKAIRKSYESDRMQAAGGIKQFLKLGTLDAGVERLVDMGVPTNDEMTALDLKPGGKNPTEAKLESSIAALDQQYKDEIATRLNQGSAQASGINTDFLAGAKPGF